MTTSKTAQFALLILLLALTAEIVGVDEANLPLYWFKEVNESDTTPLVPVTNLEETDVGSNWITWKWYNPYDADFSHVMVYVDDIFMTNISDWSYNSTGLTEGIHTISTKTVDTSGNINSTWVNDSASTATVNVELVGHFGGGRFDGDFDNVIISEDYAYISRHYFFILLPTICDFTVLDITDVDNPYKVGRVFTPSAMEGIDISGHYAFMTADSIGGIQNLPYALMTVGVTGDIAGLFIVDIADSSSPRIVGSYDTDGIASDVAISGNYAYVTYTGYNLNGLVIIDISDPSSPLLVGHYDNVGDAIGIAVEGNYAYVIAGNNGLMILNISDPSTPILVGSYNNGGYANEVAISGNYAYIADSNNGLVIVDISDPFAPTIAGSYDTVSSADHIAVSGNYAYIAACINLVIVDISDPASPRLAGSYNTADYASDVAVSSDYVYVADDDNGLIILKKEIISTEDDSLNISRQINDSSAKTALEPPTEIVEKPPIEPPEEPAGATPGFGFLLALSAIGGTFLVMRKKR